MMQIIELIVITSLFCFGFNYATLYTPNFTSELNAGGDGFTQLQTIPKDRELLWFIRYYGDKYLRKEVTKPIYGCLMCMGSVWGSVFYWSFVFGNESIINSKTIVIWVVVVAATSGLNRVLRGISQI
jgi:hypothetical protein